MRIADIEDAFAAFAPVRVRKMFGGHGIYIDDIMFAIEIGGEFGLKVDADTQPVFTAAGSTPCVYHVKGQPKPMSFWRMPDEALDDEDALRRWCALALAAARRKKAAPPAPRKPRKRA